MPSIDRYFDSRPGTDIPAPATQLARSHASSIAALPPGSLKSTLVAIEVPAWPNTAKATSQTLSQMGLTYSFRINRWSVETAYRQDDDALLWTNARGEGRVAYAAIRNVRVYKVR